MSFRKILLASTLLALPLAAQAQPITGVYIGAGAGVNLKQNSDLDAKGPLGAGLPRRGGELQYDTGWAGVLSVGYGFGNGVRAEIEGNYRYNKADGVAGFGLGPWGRDRGYAQSYGVMANVFYDFYQLNWPVIPYIGVGAGYVWTELNSVRGTSGQSGQRFAIDDTDGQFAYQAMVGASVPISAVPGLAITAEYRFMGTLDNSFKATAYDTTVPIGAPLRGKVDAENFNHAFMLGVRYAFNQPAPAIVAPIAPAAPAAAPAPARTYLVFFDFDRADLTDRARQIIAEAAQNSTRVQTTRIEVAGHADRSGSPQYNQRLSQRRADAVAAELGRLGVARSSITVQAFGESRPLVPTADGVREPQNRRVEIVLR